VLRLRLCSVETVPDIRPMAAGSRKQAMWIDIREPATEKLLMPTILSVI